ncbi:acetylglutamate kinase [Salinibacillus xinjiangensis]|uniref:Acetylglutamate kinase n=1 Tax=Salinibacillus xinjiangensis TaxID=1229268 RepID=A0A6G1X230_9BACI|nr:acetylglutamate kinase [Salinibacillus xinjiangensis]MRG84946.1 acetylglutamate kinase [Salinibacillus xinjiangensis]
MKYLIIKFGGSVLEELPFSFYQDIVDIQRRGEWKPVIVHGGGPLISELLTQLNIETTFVNGMRKTTSDVLDVVEMVLSGKVNKQVVRTLKQAGGQAIGMSGVDGDLLQASPLQDSALGYVGQVEEVNIYLIKQVVEQDLIPVISPIGLDEQGERYNINGDVAAAAVAKALGGKLCFVSNIPGIYKEVEGVKQILTQVTKPEVEEMIVSGDIKEGMIPKVKAALEALMFAVPEVVILNGKEKGSLVSFTSGNEIGTKVVL